MSTGYAVLSQAITIDGTVTVQRDWDVQIISIQELNQTGSAESAIAPTYSATTANFQVNLFSPGDALEYKITIRNFGNLNAVLNDINLVKTGNPAINFTVSNVTEGSLLSSGNVHEVIIRISYLSTQINDETTGNMTLSLSYGQQ